MSLPNLYYHHYKIIVFHPSTLTSQDQTEKNPLFFLSITRVFMDYYLFNDLKFILALLTHIWSVETVSS